MANAHLRLAALALSLLSAVPAPAAEGAGKVVTRRALPPLPLLPRLELPKPSAAELENVDALLAGLSSDALEAREAAARALLEVKPRLVPAIAARLAELSERADKEAMKRAFTELRGRSRNLERAGDGAGESAESPDYLALLLKEKPKSKPQADAKSAAYSHLVHAVALSRMLTRIGNTEAARVLIDVYARFGEFLRLPTQRELETLGDRAVPALIEARRHPNEKIAAWARRQLDALGRAVPSEAAQIPSPSVLADVLRAYGRIRDPDAVRIIVSFASSERAVIREAAREAIVLLGESGMWHVREAYEDTVGKRAARDWSWERLTRELFAELDHMRSVVVTKIYEEGEVARARGDAEAMRRAFDLVLARDPRFARREEISKAYFEYARSILAEKPKDAEESLARALRLATDPGRKRAIESRLLTVQASNALERGLLDRTLLTRALELDPGNARARQILDDLARTSSDSASSRARWLAAGTLILGALLAIVVLFRKWPWREPREAPLPGPAMPPPTGSE